MDFFILFSKEPLVRPIFGKKGKVYYPVGIEHRHLREVDCSLAWHACLC